MVLLWREHRGRKLLRLTFDLRPRRSPGCVTASGHKWTCHISLVGVLPQIISDSADIILTEISADALLSGEPGPDTDCIVIALPALDDVAEARITAAFDKIRRCVRDVPMVVFTIPRRVDGWPMQVLEATTDDLNTCLVPAVLQAIRRHRAPASYRPGTFISYARRDHRCVDSPIFTFRGTYWLDRKFVAPGVIWASKVLSAIDHADIFVLFVTPSLHDGPYCWSELRQALERERNRFS